MAQCQEGQDETEIPCRVPRGGQGTAVVQDGAWEVLDRVNLAEVFERKFNVLQNCPHHVRGRFRHACRQALEARSDAVRAHNDVGEIRA